jgi:hypothetical protein
MDEELERVLIYSAKELQLLSTLVANSTEQEDWVRVTSLCADLQAVATDMDKALKDFEARHRGERV